MEPTLPSPEAEASEQTADRTYFRVWLSLVGLTGLLVLASRLGRGTALAGLLLFTPLKAGLVLYFFMHLGREGPLIKAVVVVTLAALLTLFLLLFADPGFR